jgi:hypothetical protein
MKTNIDNYQLNNVNRPIYKEGWVCPICGAVMSPDAMSCINCKGYLLQKYDGTAIKQQPKDYVTLINTTDFNKKNVPFTET